VVENGVIPTDKTITEIKEIVGIQHYRDKALAAAGKLQESYIACRISFIFI
jgi:hypothetical protein